MRKSGEEKKKDKSKKGRTDGERGKERREKGGGEVKRTEEVGQKRKGGKRNEGRKIE